MSALRMFLSLALLTAFGAMAHADEAIRVDTAAIVMPPMSQAQSIRVVDILFDRLSRRSAADVTITRFREEDTDLHIIIGQSEDYPRLEGLQEEHGIMLPGGDAPYPESFAVKRVETDTGPLLVAIGADPRGVLYAAGEVLRQFAYNDNELLLGDVDVSTSPAYRFRGFSANQGTTMRKTTGARGWTSDELFEVVQDYALAGANIFYVERDGGALYDYVKSLGLMTHTDCRPNEFRGEIPEGWEAQGLEGWEGDHWLCPNVPDARIKLLETWREEFAKRPQHDIFRMYSGDPGGCRCERCMPWGETYIYLCEKVAGLWLEEHPDSTVLIANQDLTNAGDQAIFDYLNGAPRTWLYGLAYGPGSNAMSSYFRDELRDDLFAYAGTGPVNRYLRETLHQLPAKQKIVHYSDITHWISAQYEVENPNPYLARIFGRRTFHARPKAMYATFQSIMPFSEGDIIYSEGYHDEFHQYLWARLLWNPSQRLDDVMAEYCEYYFGVSAAPLMRQALYQLEENLECDLVESDGVEKYYGLVKAAGKRLPEKIMAEDHRWQLHMQKAALDSFVQLRVQVETARVEGAFDALATGLASDTLADAVHQAMSILSTPPGMSFAMAEKIDEAHHHGELSEERHGVRNVGVERRARALVDMKKLRADVRAVMDMEDPSEQRIATQAIIDGGVPIAPYRW